MAGRPDHPCASTTAGTSRRHIETVAPTFVVHLDVDVLAFAGAPLADVPQPFGLTLAELATAVAEGDAARAARRTRI